jgi:hypothetical protein
MALINRDNIQARLTRLGASDMVLRPLIDVLVNRIRGEARTHEWAPCSGPGKSASRRQITVNW